MTDEEIKNTSRKFAELKGGHAVCSETEIQKRALLLEQYTHFLMEDFCIVPKEQVYMRLSVANALMEQDPARKEFYQGMSSAIVSIFGKDTFEEDGK